MYRLRGERLEGHTFKDTLNYFGFNGVPVGAYFTVTDTRTSRNIYFGGRLIQSSGKTVVTDRVGSVRADEAGYKANYYPYGEQQSGTMGDGREKFGTYTRESSTGLDYANQRYYASVYGRFSAVDRSRRQLDATNPNSWSGYVYSTGDPVGLYDPTGFRAENPDHPWCGSEYLSGCYCFDDEIACVNVAGDGDAQDAAHPVLACSFSGASFEIPGFGKTPNRGDGYFMPVFFNYDSGSAMEGALWTNSQTVTLSGSISYTNGRTLPVPTATAVEHLNNVSATSSTARFFDAPGLGQVSPMGTVSSADVVWTFLLKTSVRRGQESAACPVVRWEAKISWRTVDGKPIVVGQANLLAPLR